MSCWVVPTIAAEIWGVPLDQVMYRIGIGELTTKLEHGFMFIDVAPDSPTLGERSSASANITEDELQALASDAEAEPALALVDHEETHDEDSEDELPLEPESPAHHGDWRTARKAAAKLRIPPGRAAVAA